MGRPSRRAQILGRRCGLWKKIPILQQMAESEENYLRTCLDRSICPFCKREVPPGQRVGSGARCDGVFCSLDCYARYHALTIRERLRLRAIE